MNFMYFFFFEPLSFNICLSLKCIFKRNIDIHKVSVTRNQRKDIQLYTYKNDISSITHITIQLIVSLIPLPVLVYIIFYMYNYVEKEKVN